MPDPIRRLPANPGAAVMPCCRCGAIDCPWDRLGTFVVCPVCQAALLLGEGNPLSIPTVDGVCAICCDDGGGIVPYQTWPLRRVRPIAIDLCPRHFRRLIGRRLGQKSFWRLAWQLDELGLTVEHVFLLHSAFYDENCRAIAPVEVER